MPIGTSANDPVQWSASSRGYQKVDVIRHAKPSNKCMVHVFIETQELVIGSKAIDSRLLQKDDVVDKWASAGEVISAFVVFALQNLDVALSIGEQAYEGTARQFEHSLCLQLQFIELGTGY